MGKKQGKFTMQNQYRLGVSKVNLVTRKLKLRLIEPPTLQQAVEEIDQLYGLNSVAFDDNKKMLRLAYDASRISIEDVEAILTKQGMTIDQGWWNRAKEEHYRFVDQNIKDNAAKEPWSCH